MHVQFYLTLLDTYMPDLDERAAAFAAVENIPSIQQKAEFCFKWMDSIDELDRSRHASRCRQFLLNLICFAACIEGLFFFAAFAYVYFLRSQRPAERPGGGHQLGVPRRERAHRLRLRGDRIPSRQEDPTLFDAELEAARSQAMIARGRRLRDGLRRGPAQRGRRRAVDLATCASIWNTSPTSGWRSLGIAPLYGSRNPFDFMELQDVQELTNFFERRVSAYQVGGISGPVILDEEF